MNWLHYLVEANIYLAVFYLCYCLFLNNETHYLLGRAYLLFSCVAAFILPITQLSILKPVEEITIEPIAYTPQVKPNAPIQQITIVEPEKHITMGDVLFYAYIIGAVITLAVLFYRLYRLSLLTRKSKSLYGNKYKLVQLKGDNTAFSFFNYLFIGTEVPQADTIIAHELVHIRQKHSADIIFVELLKVISWFNPLIYLMQRSLRTIHEYIADEQTAAQERDALSYSSFLLSNAYGLQGSPIAHSFFNYNLLKKRIIMLNQKRSGRLARLKYLAAVPLCVGMLCASTLVFSKDYAFIDLAPKHKPVPEKLSVNAPKTVKYFKIIDKEKNITAYSDNLSFTDEGVKKMYFAKSTTPADIAYIQKTMKLTVQVIDVDSKTKLQVPMVIMPDAKSDTAFAMRPPAKFGDGYTLQENDYLINKTTPYITVTITETNAAEKIYNSTNATDGERKMLKDKYGFEFKKDEMMAFWNATRQSNKAFSNNPKLPPPPPPVPIQNGYEQLSQWISQTVKYPAAGIAQKLKASLVADFTLGADGRISAITVTGSKDQSLLDAVKAGIAKFPNLIKEKPGKKKLGVTFFLLGNKSPAVAASAKNSPEFIGEAGIVGMTAEQSREMHRKLPPPPPPARPAKVGVVPPKVKLAPPVVVANEQVAPPEIEITPLPAVAPKPVKRIKVKPVVAPKPAVAPVVKEISEINIKLDSPIVVSDEKVVVKNLKITKTPTRLTLKNSVKENVNLKLSPVVKTDVKPLVIEVEKKP